MTRAVLLLAAFAAALAGQQPTAIDTGATLYRAHCSPCHGPEGDSIPGINLRRAEFRRVKTDDEISKLILTGIPGTAMPPSNLPEPSRIALVAYIRSLSKTAGGATSGDAARGRAIFEGKGGCTGCHRVSGKGSRVAPDLSDVGAVRPAASLEQSILEPSETILPQHRYVQATLRDGTVITGRRLNEDTHTVQLIDSHERLVSLSKSELRDYTVLKTSAMPSYRGKLSSQEVADVVAFLLSLKGSQ